MTKPRSELVDPKYARFYHISSRCVQRAWLLGKDPLSGKNFDHRKIVFLNRLQHLTRFFSVQVMGYAIMSNHFHLVVRYDPTESSNWSDEEVARRWCATFNGLAFTSSHNGPVTEEEFNLKQTLRYRELLLDKGRLERCRVALSSLSRFMQHLKQPFAVWANKESQSSGRMFESRFYSGVLLDEGDLLSCMAYVDLNPVEAEMARSLREAEHTSVNERLLERRFDAKDLDVYLSPLWEESHESSSPKKSGSAVPILSVTLERYAIQLNLMIAYRQNPDSGLMDQMESWMARLVNRERRKRGVPNAFFDYAW